MPASISFFLLRARTLRGNKEYVEKGYERVRGGLFILTIGGITRTDLRKPEREREREREREKERKVHKNDDK